MAMFEQPRAKDRSSHQRCSIRRGVLRNFSKFTGKHLYQRPFFNKLAGLAWPATLLKKRLWHRCFPVNFAKFLRTAFLQNTSRRLLLKETKIYLVSLMVCLQVQNQNTFITCNLCYASSNRIFDNSFN